jgi:hypothetical protein
MKDRVSRPKLHSFLTASGISPEVFLEALELLRDEARDFLATGTAPAPPPREEIPLQDAAAEDDAIRKILAEIYARWKQEERTKRTDKAPAPPAAPPAPAGGEDDRITLETVILGRAPGPKDRPEPAGPPRVPPSDDEQPTTILRIGQSPSATAAREEAASASAKPPVAPERVGGEEEPTVFLKVDPPGVPPQRTEEPPAEPPGEDDVAKTVILRPDRLKGKGKGGPQ